MADKSRKAELRIDVTSALPLAGPLTMAASVYLPDPATVASPPVVMFASPGGGYSRGYFDLQFDGRPGYSQAQYHAAQGMIVVAYDHLGVGESTTANNHTLTVETIADA